jgi:hypothetical protein
MVLKNDKRILSEPWVAHFGFIYITTPIFWYHEVIICSISTCTSVEGRLKQGLKMDELPGEDYSMYQCSVVQ